MAKNYKAYEAAEIISKGLNKETAAEYQDITRRFPFFAAACIKLNEAGLEMLKMMPEYITARKINKSYKESLGITDNTPDDTDEIEETEEVEEEVEEAPKKKAKKIEKKAKKEEPEDDDLDEDEEEEEEKPKKKILKKKAKKEVVEEDEDDDDDFDFDD